MSQLNLDGDRTKCPRTECSKLKLTRIMVMVEVRFMVRAVVWH